MKAPAALLSVTLALGCTEANDDPCYKNPALCSDASSVEKTDAGGKGDTEVTDGSFAPDFELDMSFGGDAMVVVDDGVRPDVVTADVGAADVSTPEPDVAIQDASVDAVVDAAVDAGPVRPCSVMIIGLESRGAVDRTMEVFCSEGPRQIGAHEGDIVFGNGNVCGVDGMPTAWGLMDAMHTVTLEALGDCGEVRVDVASRENLPTGGEPGVEGTQRNFDQNGVLRIEADDYGAGADNDGDGDTDAQRGSAVVRLHRPQVN